MQGYFSRAGVLAIASKNMFNLDEEKIECTLGKEFSFWQGKKAKKVVLLCISDIGTFGTAKQLHYTRICSLRIF